MKQTRYAVVLNGGVSLAIWMGGVTQELNRLRLASEATVDPDSGADASPAWQAILQACQRSAVVDILAGTSAGGLNGTLLATAVARGADMPNMGQQWASVASLSVGALTRVETAGAKSLLDGEFFCRKVTEILAMITPQPGVPPRECTLLVTATALESNPIPTPLEAGTMYTRDGRRVYRFERRVGSASQGAPVTSDFDPTGQTAAALAEAARASASYPVAFAPVKESPELARQLNGDTLDSAGRWLVDGGVLDNAPFEPLIDVLRERPTSEPYDRVLLYVTPGASGGDITVPSDDVPPLSETLNAVLSATREPDERLDAGALRNIFDEMSYSKSQAFQTISKYLNAPGDNTLEPLLSAAGNLFEAYRTARCEATERWLLSESAGPTVALPLAPPPPAQLQPTQIPGLPSGVFPDFDGTSWQWGWSAADRILRWWGRAMSALDSDNTASAAAMSAIGSAQREVSARDAGLSAAVAGTPASPKSRNEQLDAMAAVYSSGTDNLIAALSAAMIPTAKAIAAAVPGTDPEVLMKISLAVEVISGIFSWAADDYDTPVFRFHRITPAVDTPPGINLGAVGLNPDWPVKKLYGERLNHFGAFTSPEGRQHDWLWGRLDGASEISKQLLNAAAVPPDQAIALRSALTAEILDAENRTPAQVAADAEIVYHTTAGQMVRTMASTDGGASFRHLESTLWELTHQAGVVGAWLRALLAPEWPLKGEPHVKFTQRAIMQAARALTTLPRKYLRSKLPYR